VLSHLPRNDVDNDISQGNVDVASRDMEKDLARSSKNRVEQIEEDPQREAWLQRELSESLEAKSRSSNGEDGRIALEERALLADAIEEEDGSEQGGSSTRRATIYPRPTTMRGIPLARLISSSQLMTRGFYVTRSENDLSTASTAPIPANNTSTTCPRSTERTETTLISDLSTTGNGDDIVNARGNGPRRDSVDANSIEEDFFLSSLSSGLSSKVSNDADENLSDYGEIDAVTTLARSAAKRGKSLLRNFDKFLDKAAPPRSVVPSSSTTPTRRKIALAVSRYNDATAPLWTGKRIVARKRNRSTLPPIERVAITRTESDFREAFATSAASSSTPISTTRELSKTTAAWLTTPAIASKYTDVLSEASNILEDSADFIDRTLEDSEKRTEATIGPTDPTDPIFPIPKPLASTATTVVTHGLSTPTADDPAVVNASATVTTSPAGLAVADAFAATSDTVTMTTSFATEIEDAEIETTKSQIVRYSSAMTARMNSTIATTVSTAASLESRVPTIANYSPMTVNPRNVDSYESAIEPAIGTTLESASTTIETTHKSITNYPSIVVPTIRANAHTPTSTTPAIDRSPLTTATVTSITDTRDTDAIASATTRDLVNVNSDATTDTTANTVTPAITPVIDATTTTDPNVTAIADANVSLTITPASVDTLTATDTDTVTVTEVDPATFEPPVTRASLTVSDEISSTENTWAISPAILELSSVFDVDSIERANDDGSSVSTIAESIGITELDTVFETSRTWRTSPVTTVISRSPSDPETSTVVTTHSFPIQTNDRLAMPSMPDAQTWPILLSIPITVDSSTTDDPSIAIPCTVIPSTTSRPDSVQTTDGKATLKLRETNEVNRGLEEASASTVAQDSQTDSQDFRNRKVTSINETDSLARTAKEERTKASIAVDKTASRNAQNRAANQTKPNETEHETENDRAFAQKFASGRRVLNRANNWIGRPLAQRPIDRYPRRRVTVHRPRGRSRRPSEYTSSSKVVIEESHGGRIARKRPRVKTISGTVRPENISEERIAHRQNGTTNATRRMRVVVKRIKEKLTEENASVSSVQGTTVLYESSTNNETRLQPRRESEDIERGRQVASKRSRSRSRKESTTNGGIDATDSDSTDQTLPNGSRSDLRLDKTFIAERIKTRGGMRLKSVLKSVRRKSEEEDVTERATADSDHADNGLRSESPSNDSYVGNDNLSGKENATRKRVRVVLKSVRPRFETRDVETIEQPNTNFRLRPTHARLTRDDNFRTSENLEDEKEGKTRGRTRIVLKRVKPKFKEEKRITVEEIDVGKNVDENVEKISTNDRHESKNLSLQYSEGTKVVSEGIESKSEIDSTEGRSGLRLLDEEAARGDQTEAASDGIERIKFAEKDSVAEETNTDLNFAIQDPRVTFPFNFSNNLRATKRQNVTSDKTLFVRDNDSSNNNLRMDDESSDVKQTRKEMESSYEDKGTMIEQSERFDTDLRTESVARVEEDTDRLSLEVSVVLNIEDPLLDNTVYFLARSHVKA